MYAVTYLDDTQVFSTEEGAREFARYLSARGIPSTVGQVIGC